MYAVLGGIAATALAVPAIVVSRAPDVPPRIVAKVRQPQRVVAATELPQVEPVELQDLTPDEARAYNAGVLFARGMNPAARPFRFAGDEAARSRATDCLAAATWYEAGDDPVGQRAVAQVVLNRLRHPAFPKTVCGVVFQGQERTTGCQFTFTCDGALARRPSEPAWDRARRIATEALNGAVFGKVGYSTHYHTDWVVPYWSASLDKVSEVHTHLFFRWSGWWGTPPAFRRAVSGAEPVIDKLAAISPAHRDGAVLDEATQAIAAAVPMVGAVPSPVPGDPDSFTVNLGGIPAEAFPDLARKACGTRSRCKVTGWTDKPQRPSGASPTAQQLAAMSFSYLRDRATGFERELWNCREFPATGPGLCMRRQAVPASTAEPALRLPAERGPDDLGGVRRARPAPPGPAAAAYPTPRPPAIAPLP